jgi:methylated-DNA-protein-cysteine methyltransferase-like protein
VPAPQNFAYKVAEVVALIPPGRVSTYGAIANYLGTGMSARMVGHVLGKSIEGHTVLPAHRVVNAQGLLTGAHAFPPAHSMEDRLAQEGVAVIDNRVVDFGRLFWDPARHL